MIDDESDRERIVGLSSNSCKTRHSKTDLGETVHGPRRII